MKISEQGFTERISGQTNRTDSVNNSSSNAASASKNRQASSDSLQLSSIATQLQSTSSDNNRSALISQIAKAVNSGTFQINTAQISKSMVSEAITAAR